MATLQELRLAQKQVDETRALLEKRANYRNEVMAELLRAGGSPTKLAKETGMSRARIYQIIDYVGIAR